MHMSRDMMAGTLIYGALAQQYQLGSFYFNYPHYVYGLERAPSPFSNMATSDPIEVSVHAIPAPPVTEDLTIVDPAEVGLDAVGENLNNLSCPGGVSLENTSPASLVTNSITPS